VRDETFDYGLEPGESFEPIDDGADSFDLSQPHIVTALGPIDPDDLGFTACLSPSVENDDRWSRNPGGTVAALEDAYNGGLRALLIAEPMRSEQEVADLVWIAGRSPVHLIVTKDPIRRDIFTDTSLKPGCLRISMMPFIPQVARTVLDYPERLPVVLTFEPGPSVMVLSPSTARLADLERIAETPTQPESEATSIELGTFNPVRVSFDRPRQIPGFTLVHPEHAYLLLLALGPSPSSWAEAVERSPLELMELGLDAPTVRRILVDNPVRALTIRA
jgi:hypothetical protein